MTPHDTAQDDDAEGGPGHAAASDAGQDAGAAAPAAVAPGGAAPAQAKEVNFAVRRQLFTVLLYESRLISGRQAVNGHYFDDRERTRTYFHP